MYLEWSSEEKSFRQYNKETKQKDLISIGKLLVLKEMHTVKGWSDSEQSGIFSNEVEQIGKDEIHVRTFSGKIIAKGIYKEIKDQIEKAGGRYVKSVYCMTESGEVINIQLKGATVKSWGDSFNKSRARMADEWISIDAIVEEKKGRVNYSFPTWKFDGVTSKEQYKQADEAYEALIAKLAGKPTESQDDEFEMLEDEVDF